MRSLRDRCTLLFGALAVLTSPLAAQRAPGLPHEKYTLPNGLEVILHVDRSVPIVAVNTWYKVGSGDEKPGRTGFAHLYEHIMFMGSEHVPVGKFDQWLEAAGASNNGTTNGDRTNYYETGPSNALKLMLWLDADRMGYLLPTMDQPKLDLQRDVVKNERRQNVENQPYGLVQESLVPVLFPTGHPYSWTTIGSMADLSAASLDDVKDFFRQYYAPNNATIAIAGDFEPDSVKRWIRDYFGGIPRGSAAIVRPSVPTASRARDTVLVLEDRVQLPRLLWTFNTVKAFHADEAALDAAAEVLAGGKSSRLYKLLVYEKQIAQDVAAYNYGQRLDGFFSMQATAKPGQHPREFAAAFDAAIRELATSGPTDRELEQVKNGMRATMLDALSSVLGKTDRLNYYNYFVGQPDYLAQDLARYERLTRDDVRRAAQEYLMKPKVVLTVVPEGKRDLAVSGGAN
ncbi:MAG: insulinase family protein [Gemmatimonadaceae bacterium]|jgi:zinc protease|nr:insulinase family protein [Gemmatimonadaceae bacterium]